MVFYLQAFCKVCVRVIAVSLLSCLFPVATTDIIGWIIYKEKIYSHSSEDFVALVRAFLLYQNMAREYRNGPEKARTVSLIHFIHLIHFCVTKLFTQK